MNDNEKPAWQKEFDRVQFNAVYFIEKYYNKLVSEKERLILTDDEKQKIYNEYKGIPLVKNPSQFSEMIKKKDELKAKGYKDWEIS